MLLKDFFGPQFNALKDTVRIIVIFVHAYSLLQSLLSLACRHSGPNHSKRTRGICTRSNTQRSCRPSPRRSWRRGRCCWRSCACCHSAMNSEVRASGSAIASKLKRSAGTNFSTFCDLLTCQWLPKKLIEEEDTSALSREIATNTSPCEAFLLFWKGACQRNFAKTLTDIHDFLRKRYFSCFDQRVRAIHASLWRKSREKTHGTKPQRSAAILSAFFFPPAFWAANLSSSMGRPT